MTAVKKTVAFSNVVLDSSSRPATAKSWQTRDIGKRFEEANSGEEVFMRYDPLLHCFCTTTRQISIRKDEGMLAQYRDACNSAEVRKSDRLPLPTGLEDNPSEVKTTETAAFGVCAKVRYRLFCIQLDSLCECGVENTDEEILQALTLPEQYTDPMSTDCTWQTFRSPKKSIFADPPRRCAICKPVCTVSLCLKQCSGQPCRRVVTKDAKGQNITTLLLKQYPANIIIAKNAMNLTFSFV
jgi:hypothetical protein